MCVLFFLFIYLVRTGPLITCLRGLRGRSWTRSPENQNKPGSSGETSGEGNEIYFHLLRHALFWVPSSKNMFVFRALLPRPTATDGGKSCPQSEWRRVDGMSRFSSKRRSFRLRSKRRFIGHRRSPGRTERMILMRRANALTLTQMVAVRASYFRSASVARVESLSHACLTNRLWSHVDSGANVSSWQRAPESQLTRGRSGGGSSARARSWTCGSLAC